MLRPVYTEPENCQDCYKCIRECPVKAIRIENNKASIIAERCVYCGHCTQVCPTGAKKIRDGLTRAKLVVSKHPGKMYMSLAPSYVSEFGDIPVGRLISAIKRLGFAGVSETALGAELVTAETERFLAAAPEGVYLSSACPVVVDYIRKYAPELTANITPIVSPMIAHAKILKELYGDDIKIIFAGPCIGKNRKPIPTAALWRWPSPSRTCGRGSNGRVSNRRRPRPTAKRPSSPTTPEPGRCIR